MRRQPEGPEERTFFFESFLKPVIRDFSGSRVNLAEVITMNFPVQSGLDFGNLSEVLFNAGAD
jgi:hypothetical protein